MWCATIHSSLNRHLYPEEFFTKTVWAIAEHAVDTGSSYIPPSLPTTLILLILPKASWISNRIKTKFSLKLETLSTFYELEWYQDIKQNHSFRKRCSDCIILEINLSFLQTSQRDMIRFGLYNKGKFFIHSKICHASMFSLRLKRTYFMGFNTCDTVFPAWRPKSANLRWASQVGLIKGIWFSWCSWDW